jgi:hypothetical protein
MDHRQVWSHLADHPDYSGQAAAGQESPEVFRRHESMLQMRKIDIKKLQQAYDQA